MGYDNVMVLYEGYWHWKDSNYPVDGHDGTVTAKLHLRGAVSETGTPVAGTDVFLRHRRSGQIEAVRTDGAGRFELEFHLYDAQQGDRFDVLLSDINSLPRSQLAMSDFSRGFANIELW